MQHYPKIAVADGEDRANLFAGHSIHFAHHLPELGTMHHLIRLGFPFMRPVIVIPKTASDNFPENSSERNSMSVNDVSRPSFQSLFRSDPDLHGGHLEDAAQHWFSSGFDEHTADAFIQRSALPL